MLGAMWCPRCNRTWDDEDARFCPRDGSELSGSPDVEVLRVTQSMQSGVLLGARYQIRGFIGRGAMGRVYLAQDLETHEPVAVKVLDIATHKDPEARERFLHEARAVAGIQHQNIVNIFETGERGDGAPYLVMEYLFGESLGDYLRREKRMPARMAMPFFSKTASALAAAHGAGVIHRDVKPDNLFLIGEPGEPYDVRLLDFGFAKLRTSMRTAAGIAIGTPGYMAPEQVLTDAVDARTDVFGLGALMYRALAGRLPFSAEDDAEMLGQIVLFPVPSLLEVDAAIDPRLDAITRTAMRKRPENRYASMTEMLHDLEDLRAARGGAAFAERAIVEPDVYEPVGMIAKGALTQFRRLLELRAAKRRNAAAE